VSVQGQSIFSQKEVCVVQQIQSWPDRTEWWLTEIQRQTKGLTHWWKLCHCQRFDKGRLKSQSLWNCWSDRYCKKLCLWNHLRFKLSSVFSEHNLTLQPRQWPGWKKCKWEVLQHPPHSPDLAPSNFYLFRSFKNYLSGKRYEDQNTLQKNSCAVCHILWKATLPWRNVWTCKTMG
jgi:hypothetical protein